MLEWLRNLLKSEVTFKIKRYVVEMPKDGECVVFQFPKGTPMEVVREFDSRLVEFQNMNRKFITTDIELRMVRTKKGKMEVKEDGEDFEIGGLKISKGKGPDKAGSAGTDKNKKA